MKYLVQDEQGDQLLLRRFDGTDGWAQKDDCVPVKESIEYFTKAIADDPDKAALNYRLRAAAHHILADNDAALRDITEAIELDPKSFANYHHRANYWSAKKEYAKAFADLEAGLERKPGYVPMILFRARLQLVTKDFGEAVKSFEEILNADPQNAEVLNGLAWILCTNAKAEIRDGRRAVLLAERAVEVTKRKSGSYLDTLAAAYAEVGRFDDAVRVQQEALNDRAFVLHDGNGGNDRLDLYRRRKAYHEK
jgi:tetratricopeptide (TPR) repeat protein